ncbi:MAG: hypothetical protein AAF802_22870 [Planctomycetota bacterium]
MDADKIKDFIVHNFEKAIVLGVVALSGFLIWSGLGKPVVTNQYDPEDQESQARLVKGEIDNDHNAQVVDPREPTFDIAQELRKARKAIPSNIYVPESPWDISTMSAEKVARKDPKLSKPAGLEVNGVIASMAYRSTDGLYPLQDLEPAGELEVVEKKPTRSRRNRRGGGMDEYGDMMGGMMGDMSGGGYGDDDYGDMMGMGDYGNMMGGGRGGTGTTGTETVRKLDPADNLGYKPSTTKDLKTKADQEPVPGIGWFIAGTAAIPHKEMIDAYQEALSNAAGYMPDRRDRPIYMAYQVERADVTDKSIADLKEDDWILRDDNERTLRNAVLYWSGVADEIVPRDYWVNGVTMWIPPVMLDPATDFATNALVPLKTKKELDLEKMKREKEEEDKNATPMTDDDIEVNITGDANNGFMGGQGDYGGMGGMGDYGDMMGGMGDYGDMMGGMGDYGDMMGGGRGGMGGYGGSTGMAGKPAEANPVDYKLLRFYDFAYIPGAARDANAPRPNRKYVYRIRFAVNDPNFPEDAKLQPKGRELDSEAYEQFIAKTAKSRETKIRDFKRWSEWSEISAPVSLPSLDRAVVGPVKANKAKRISSGNRSIVVEAGSPEAEVVAESFDFRLKVFVPTRMTVKEGTILSEPVEKADVVDPITLEIKEAIDKIVTSSATIIDIEGGLPLEIVEEDEMTEPGMFLMIDSQGRLRVKDSVEEQQVYRIRSYADERGLD